MKEIKGYFTELDGEEFYKIENYDQMEDFFMTITSSSDIWNFCWAQGGITAGRTDCDHAIFPYYTADKVSDAKSFTGSYTLIDDGKNLWEPFASLYAGAAGRIQSEQSIRRNIYKNISGTKVWFEEINEEIGLSFRYGWESSPKFGLVKVSVIENLTDAPVNLRILDGARNILPACVTADFQNTNSVLLDAYKKTEVDEESNIALFTVSSIVTDKAEPSEGLFANVSWFSESEGIIINTDSPTLFAKRKEIPFQKNVNGRRACAFIKKEFMLSDKKSRRWFQVFAPHLSLPNIISLKSKLLNREQAAEELKNDISEGEKAMLFCISQADGIQHTAQRMTSAHHSENVMFNIMRGGYFLDGGKINLNDFVSFIKKRNLSLEKTALQAALSTGKKDGLVDYKTLKTSVEETKNPQLLRLFLEYMPLTFSRRHGDPSRPWNRFNIHLTDKNGKPVLNYEGNWRDIFQNWEALAWSYPCYIQNMICTFLSAMTADGFNPYRISRDGIDWEIPDPKNPWAQIGYWGDHQVIYLEKLLEFFSKTDEEGLLSLLDKKIFSSANVPYRIKPYSEIVKNPRDTISFDSILSDRLKKLSEEKGTDEKLIKDKNNGVAMISMTAKLLQIVIAKAANFVPGGGIWLNTQRPEWNDANNALAGFGLSVVTLCYLYRYLDFLTGTFSKAKQEAFPVPKTIADAFVSLSALFELTNPNEPLFNAQKRKEFTDKAGLIFETERNELYKNGYECKEALLLKSDIINGLKAIQNHAKQTILSNKRDDSLYHSYNTMRITDTEIQIERLEEMLEGQVAVLSSTLLDADEAYIVLTALKNSPIYEKRQNSYMLYPNKELLPFLKKNTVPVQTQEEVEFLKKIQSKSNGSIVETDENGGFHFNPEFRNSRFLKEALQKQPDKKQFTTEEEEKLAVLYERTFNHISFTGRSGTFFAYEGLGSIYWHMVSKLLLAAQENALKAIKENARRSKELVKIYYDIRAGLSFNKTPELYGAFPMDPYSHTPWQSGAKQPGMTGQVKEEILTRWGELGVCIKDGTASFEPTILCEDEFFEDGTLDFTWCGAKITYIKNGKAEISVNKKKRSGNSLTKQETQELFSRSGKIKTIEIGGM